MANTKNRQQNINHEEVTGESGDMGLDEGAGCENGSCANVADAGQTVGDNSSDMAENNAAEEWKDKYMRLSAEFDNYRKRTLKEKMDLIAIGGEDVITALLPVLDDMDRALDVMRKAEDMDSVRSGIELISQKLRDTLKNKGVREIEAIGEALDTDFHDAVARTPAPNEKQKGKIIDVVQKGYTLKDKVVRHAKVVVGE